LHVGFSIEIAGVLPVAEISIEGLNEDVFRRSIERMLRHGQADDAAAKLRALIEPYAGEGGVLPARFLAITSADIRLTGWNSLGQRLGEHDRPDHEISALAITVVEPDRPRTDSGESGNLAPRIETSYFSDEAYPFSQAERSDLLEGYSLFGCEWQGECEETDSTLAVEGVDDLYGAIVRLEAQLMDSEDPDEDEIRAGSLGASYLAVLIHQAVRDTIRTAGLPRAMCVMAASNGVYPFFDAPVMSSEEYLDNRTISPVQVHAPTVEPDAEEPLESAVGAQPTEYQSLLSIGVRKPKKRPVIMLEPDEGEAEANMDWLAAARLNEDSGKAKPVGSLSGLSGAQPAAYAGPDEDAEPDIFEDPASFREFSEPATPDWGDEPPIPDEPHFFDEPHFSDEPDEPEEPAAPIEITPPASLGNSLWTVTYFDDDESREPARNTVESIAPLPPEPAPAHHRHSLRTRIVERSDASLTQRSPVLSFLARLLDLIRRF
jgi:hypothetical protein